MKNDENHEMLPNDEKNEVSFSATEKYSFKYRMIKTSLLILAWVSFGLQNELVGPAYEDLKTLLNINNEQISFTLTLKAFASLITVPIGGILLDKFSKYADLFMAICCLFMALRKK
jgi:MFS family permease